MRLNDLPLGELESWLRSWLRGLPADAFPRDRRLKKELAAAAQASPDYATFRAKLIKLGRDAS
jgi:hypothetical protein